MGWVDKSPDVKPRKTFECDACFERFQWREETDPEFCPKCGATADGAEQVILAPGRIGSLQSKAADYVQHMAEEDYGMTDMNSCTREGDIAAKTTVLSTSQKETLAQEAAEFLRDKVGVDHLRADVANSVKNYWQPNGGDVGNIAHAAEAARADGVEPLSIIQSLKNRPMGRALNRSAT